MTQPTAWDPTKASPYESLSPNGAVAYSTSGGAVLANRSLTAPLSYFEISVVNISGGAAASVGVANRSFNVAGGAELGNDANGVGYNSSGAVLINGSAVATIAPYATGATVGVAVNLALQLIWFTLDGATWNDDVIANQDPAGNVGGISLAAMTRLDGAAYPAVWSSAGTPSALGGTASSSSDYSGGSTALAFDGLQSTFWASSGSGDPAPYLEYEFPSATAVGSFVFYPRDDSYGPLQGPASISVEGSNDGSTWSALGSISDALPWAEGVGQTVVSSEPSTAFLYYRANMAWQPTAPGGNTALAEFEFFSPEGFPLPTPPCVLAGAFASSGFAHSLPSGYSAAALCGATARNSDAGATASYAALGGAMKAPVASQTNARASTRDMGRGTALFAPAGTITRASGTVLQAGSPVSKTVRLYDTATGALIGATTSSAADGSYSIPALGRPKVDVVAKDPTSYQALIYDNVTPE